MWLSHIATLSLLIATARSGSSTTVSVPTRQGVVIGLIEDDTPSVRQFLSIPFAVPPIGNLRFAPPKPIKEVGFIKATKMGPSCMQVVGTASPPELGIEGGNPNPKLSEDCLTLSIWTPNGKNRGSKLPVIVFVHGGAFIAGGQNVPYDIPAQWVERTKHHIVVAINYRLGFFGFPTSAALGEHNLGLLDQRLAIEWVRDSIAEFGGDPSRILLWGQSAGAISIGYYQYAFVDDPIVSGFAMDSGSELTLGGKEADNHDDFTTVTQKLDCGGRSAAAELACVRKRPSEVIINAVKNSGLVFFSPIADEKLVFADYNKQAAAGRISKLPAIIGSNADENSVFAICPSFRTSMQVAPRPNRLKAGAPTFRYQFHGNFTNLSHNGTMGAYHGSELPLLMGTHSLYRGNSTELEWATSAAMQDAWVAFARGGVDGLAKKAGWPLYDNVESGKLMFFGKDVPKSIGNSRDVELQCN
ncbi:alpha/beta-hydrolase [Dactylonectria macrodidyma]|uniref:Carboxylic ester hydrolase n=1 Tax=Dactylonectria macrodidyma TaxID=307937 RepID=A0A9P9D2D7_9HYPO|nr:alpha/beta-hydrolase [Dactylonectria macrodidyma]